MNFESELYGMERLRDLICNCDPDVKVMGKTIREDVRKHADGRPQNDDITMMVFGRSAT
jgi:serine phosphatase RsbU (regulator of sigma subunit)